MTPDELFARLGAEIPPQLDVPPDLSFVPWRRTGTVLWVAGHGPNRLKKPPEFDYVGQIGKDLTREDGYAAARLVGLGLLVTIRAALGSLNEVRQVLQVIGAVNSAPSFTGQSYVLNGCTDLFRDIFGDDGMPARVAFGAAELPFGMAVEAATVVEIKC